MAKKKQKIITKILHHGLYAKWSNQCKELPRFLKYTDTIPARIEAEFGCIIEVVGAKGQSISYTIEHPSFTDSRGNPSPPFLGEIPIRSATFQAYLGDTLWEPIEDKIGIWRVIGRIGDEKIADFSFEIVPDTGQYGEVIEQYAHFHT